MSILTLYFANGVQSGSSAGNLTLTQPGASTSTTGWGVADETPPAYSRMSFARERPRLEPTGTAQPSGSPLGQAEDCFRISDTTTGDFSAGTWYSSLSVIAVTSGSDQDGRARFRLWRSINADGTGATEITAGTMVGSNTTNLTTTVAQSSSASTQIGAFSLAGEYLFGQVAWEINSNVGTNTRDVLIRFGSLAQTSGSGLITADFAATGGAPVVSGAGLYNNYYKNIVQGVL